MQQPSHWSLFRHAVTGLLLGALAAGTVSAQGRPIETDLGGEPGSIVGDRVLNIIEGNVDEREHMAARSAFSFRRISVRYRDSIQDGLWLGASLGAVAGLAVGLMSSDTPVRNLDDRCAVFCGGPTIGGGASLPALTALLGAGIGAGVGAVIDLSKDSSHVVVSREPDPVLVVAPVLSNGRRGAGLLVQW